MIRNILLTFFILCTRVIYAVDTPVAVYVGLADHPESNMFVQWISEREDFPTKIQYRAKDDLTSWQETNSSIRKIPDGSGLFHHRVLLKNLHDNTIYLFRIGTDPKEYQFRTLPAHLSEPLRFVDGGDVHHDELFYVRQLSKHAAAQNPHFVILGGDITYYKCRMDRYNPQPRWLGLIKSFETDLVDYQGCIIPVATCIGNHDIQFSSSDSYSCAPFFHTLFATPGNKGYQALDIGDYFSLMMLDSGHSNTVWGEQTHWLNEALAARRERPYLFAMYHIPAYPSVRRFEGKISAAVRMYWTPLFDKYNLIAAFEHHDHAYKRTFPIRGNKKDSTGVTYLGDGAWGVKNPRTPAQPHQKWYLASTAKKRNFHLVTLNNNNVQFKALDDHGDVLDEFVWQKQEAAVAQKENL